MGLSSCAEESNKVVKECILPEDQAGSLAGRWPSSPIPVAVHEGDFDSSEVGEIAAAASSWNSFFGKSKGLQILEFQNGSSSSVAKPLNVCGQGIINNSGSSAQFTGDVVIYKQEEWPYPNLSEVIALTSYCPVAATPLKRFYMAIMEINYENFFAGGKQPDLQSIILHEFGHLLGLLHSCEGAAGNGIPGCNESGISGDYLSAVMFPVIQFPDGVNGEQRRALKTNDQGRANCLYGTGAF